MEKPLAVVYQRVSTDKQDNSRQLADITNYCQKENIEIVKTYEEKLSGKIRNRPELMNLLNYIRSNSDKIKYCIFSEVSRLGRTTVGVLNFLEELNSLKICSIFINDGKRTLKEDGSVDNDVMMLLTILSGINARELDSISYKVKSGLQNSALKGNIGGGVYPYGYTRLSNDNKQMIINPEEAMNVQTMFNMSLNNVSTIGIARYLNSQNILPRKINKWKNSTVYKILTNELYIGLREHKQTINKDATGIKTYEISKFNSPAIVDKSIFENVQENLKNRSSFGGGKLAHEYMLNNKKLICGCCGMSYFPHFRKDKTSTYECGSTLNGNNSCGNGTVPINKIEALITDIITSKFSNMITKYTNVQNFEADLKKLGMDLSGYTEYLAKERKKEDVLIDYSIDGNITKEQFLNKVAPIRQEISNVEAKIKTIGEEIKRTEVLLSNKLNIGKILQNWKAEGADKSILKKIIQSVTIIKATDEELNRSAEPDDVTEVTPEFSELKEPLSAVELCSWKNNVNYKLEIIVNGLPFIVYMASRANKYYFDGHYYTYEI